MCPAVRLWHSVLKLDWLRGIYLGTDRCVGIRVPFRRCLQHEYTSNVRFPWMESKKGEASSNPLWRPMHRCQSLASIECIAPELNAMPSYAYMFNGGAGSSMLSQAWHDKTSWSWLHDASTFRPLQALKRKSIETQAQLFTSSTLWVWWTE